MEKGLKEIFKEEENKIIKKLLIFISQIFISGCNITGLIVREGEKITYTFAWPTVLVLLIIIIVVLWVIKYFRKNTK